MPTRPRRSSRCSRPGHRLVSRDGGLWRWDGFVRAPGGEDRAAARVRHRSAAARRPRGAGCARPRAGRAGGSGRRPASWRCRRARLALARGRSALAGGGYGPAARAAAAGRGGGPCRAAGRRAGVTLAQEAAALEREAPSWSASEPGDRACSGEHCADEAALAAALAGERAALAQAERKLAASGGGAERVSRRLAQQRDPAAHIAGALRAGAAPHWSRRGATAMPAARACRSSRRPSGGRARRRWSARCARAGSGAGGGRAGDVRQPSKRPSARSRSAPRRSARSVGCRGGTAAAGRCAGGLRVPRPRRWRTARRP